MIENGSAAWAKTWSKIIRPNQRCHDFKTRAKNTKTKSSKFTRTFDPEIEIALVENDKTE